MARNARWADVTLGAATAAIVAAAVTANVRGDGTPAIAYVFAGGFGALMLVRRPYPVLALAASVLGLLGYYVIGLPPIGLALPVGAALYSAAEARKLRWAIGAAATLVAVSYVARGLGGEDPGYLYAYELPTTVAVMAAAILLGDVVRTRRLWRAEVAAGLAREADRRLQDERLALARDLHDVLAHTVSVVTLHADVADEALDDGDTDAARRAIRRVREASAGAGRELRGTLAALRGWQPAAGAEASRHMPAGPGESAVEAPIGVLARLADLTADAPPVDVTVEGEVRPLPQVVDATAYRIIQEALTNARRHAAGRSVRLTVSYKPDKVALRIVNEGGPNAPSGTGHGLNGMRERATLLGGTLQAGAAPGGMFVVTATLPAEPST